MSLYHYRECGLGNVYVDELQVTTDYEGDEILNIPNVSGLHRAIVAALIEKPSGLTGTELRFLRTELGMTQAKLAAIVHREPLAISRWERDEVKDIDPNAETLIRLVARDQFGLTIAAPISEISKWSVPSANTPTIIIDCTESGYRVRDPSSSKDADQKEKIVA
jgi:transcriptional regulator with XRE-family HTH domain